MMDDDYNLFKKLINEPDRIDDAIEIIRNVALSGKPGAENELADALIKRGSSEDIEEAIDICRKGMHNGNLWSQGRMARYYRDGIGVEKDLDEAINLMIKPSEARIKWAVKDLELMLIERNAEGDSEMLFRLYLIGSLEGDDWSQIKAARCFVNGIGVKRDLTIARVLYTQSSIKNEVARHELRMIPKQ